MINRKRIKKKTQLPMMILVTSILIILLFVSNYYNYFSDIKIMFRNIGANIKNALTIKIDSIDNNILIGIDNELLEENIELRKLLDIDSNNYEIITCSIISRDITWSNTLTLNKGKKDNIDIDMSVVNSNNLVGRIVEVGDNYSIVELITNPNFSKIAVDINGIETYQAILDSYDGNALIIKNVNKNNNIVIGDKVYTNGLGGIYPAGIYIGEVTDIKTNELALAKELKVGIDNSFNNMRYVNVIRR